MKERLRARLRMVFLALVMLDPCFVRIIPAYEDLGSYRFCSSTDTALLYEYHVGGYNFTTAVQVCEGYDGKLLSLETFQANCTDGMHLSTMAAWIDDKGYQNSNGDRVYWSTYNYGYFENQGLQAICEIPCNRTAGDHIAGITPDGSVICDPGYVYRHSQPVCKETTHVTSCIPHQELGGYHFCNLTHTVLQETPREVRLNYTTAVQVCDGNNGKVLSWKAFKSHCATGMQLDEREAAWIRSNGYIASTGKRIRWITKDFGTSEDPRLRTICEIACQRAAEDHISTITPEGNVICYPGYVYLHSQPVCKGTTQVLSCVRQLNNSSSTLLVVGIGIGSFAFGCIITVIVISMFQRIRSKTNKIRNEPQVSSDALHCNEGAVNMTESDLYGNSESDLQAKRPDCDCNVYSTTH
eukprot:scpid71263/ scgid25454/ 